LWKLKHVNQFNNLSQAQVTIVPDVMGYQDTGMHMGNKPNQKDT